MEVAIFRACVRFFCSVYELTLSDRGVLKHSMPGGTLLPVYLCCYLRYGNIIWHECCSLHKIIIFATIIQLATLLLLLESDYDYDVI